jgi:hypothetical protein
MWEVSGNVIFYHRSAPAYPPLLEIQFKYALLTSWSTSPTAIGKTMTLQDSQRVDGGIYMFPHPLLNGVGILPECLKQYQDLAFTFTNIRPVTNPADVVHLDPTGKFVEEWVSEGSFSASGCLDLPML